MTLFFCCAKEGMPPGGPEDRTPPAVIHTVPRAGALNVPPGDRAVIEFSEPVRSRSMSDALYISPYPGEVRLKWRSKRLMIQFPEPFQAGQTYVITLGTGISDYRNNSMDSTFTLAFSTGDRLDVGKISGRYVSDGDARGVDVWAYHLRTGLVPDPASRPPHYIVQCSEDGRFRFSHLAGGRYRLFVVKDRLKDRLYTPMEDEIGVGYRDAYVSKETGWMDSGLFFRSHREDTLGPALVQSRALDRRHVAMQFSESVRPGPGGLIKDFQLTETLSGDTVPAALVYVDPANPRLVHLYTDQDLSKQNYRVFVHHIEDDASNPVDTARNSFEFPGAEAADTTAPVLMAVSPAPGSRLVPLDPEIRLVFREAMDSTGFAGGFSLADTMQHDVPGKLKWISPAEMAFIPGQELESLTVYRVFLNGAQITDLAGNAAADTVIQFRTINADTLSEISGMIDDPSPSGTGPFVVTAVRIGEQTAGRDVVLRDPGRFLFTELLPGDYVLEAYRDEDHDSRYSFGVPFPFRPAERFTVYQDTIHLRARWPNEGNDFQLPLSSRIHMQ